MKHLIALADVRLGSTWYKKGDALPGNVVGFNYEKAARKGLIEDEDGDDIVNPTTTEPEASADAAEARGALETVQLALAEQRKEAERLSGLLNETGAKATNLAKERDDLKAQVGKLQADLKTAQASAADPADMAALAEYREVVGELLPGDFPARKVLLEGGYYTVAAVSAASDDDLSALDGIADRTLVKIREKAPAAPATATEQ